LRIRHLRLTDLRQVDLIGRNDPYAVLSYGDHFRRQTQAIAEGGADVEWNLSEQGQGQGKEKEAFQFIVTPEELSLPGAAEGTQQQRQGQGQGPGCGLEVAVYDANQYRSDVLIGEVCVALSPLQFLTSYGEEVTLTREIKKKGKVTGCCALTCDFQRLLTVTGALSSSSSSSSSSRQEKSSVHSLSELLRERSLTEDFLRYLARRHLDLFLSRAKGVMLLRIIG
jgi:hypothetical protein